MQQSRRTKPAGGRTPSSQSGNVASTPQKKQASSSKPKSSPVKYRKPSATGYPKKSGPTQGRSRKSQLEIPAEPVYTETQIQRCLVLCRDVEADVKSPPSILTRSDRQLVQMLSQAVQRNGTQTVCSNSQPQPALPAIGSGQLMSSQESQVTNGQAMQSALNPSSQGSGSRQTQVFQLEVQKCSCACSSSSHSSHQVSHQP